MWVSLFRRLLFVHSSIVMMDIALHIIMVLIDSSQFYLFFHYSCMSFFSASDFYSADYSISRSKFAIRNITAEVSVGLVKLSLPILSVSPIWWRVNPLPWNPYPNT